MKRLGLQRRLGALLLPMVLATGAYGLTASNTVPDTDAGDGSDTVTGYTVTNVNYNLNATNPFNVDSVTFDLTAADGTYEAPDTIKIRLDSVANVWYSCTGEGTVTGGTTDDFTCNTTAGTQATESATNQLRVVAVE